MKIGPELANIPWNRAQLYSCQFDHEERLARETPLLEEFLHLLPPAPDGPARILDVACGPGLHAAWFGRRGLRAEGVDADPDMVSLAAGLYGSVADYRTGDFSRLDGGPYQGILFIGNTISAVPDAARLREVLDGIARTLAPDGILLLHHLNYAEGRWREPRVRMRQTSLDGRVLVAMKTMAARGDRVLASFAYFLPEAGWACADTHGGALRRIPVDEAQTCAREAGLVLVSRYGAPALTPFDEERSDDLFMIFRRKALKMES